MTTTLIVIIITVTVIYASIVRCVAGGQQGIPVRPLMQTGVRPLNSQPFVDNADKHPANAVARLLASGVADHHRLPNIPAQLAKTVDEIECAAAPPAAN